MIEGFYEFDIIGAELSGIPIFIHPLLPMQLNRRALKPKSWHSKAGCYRNRVDKKWRKRFGTDAVHILRGPSGFFISRAANDHLRKSLEGVLHGH